MTRAALPIALALALLPAASAFAASPHVLVEHDLPGMKASFSATHPLTTIKRFVLVYSDDAAASGTRSSCASAASARGTATALFQSAASRDATKPVAVWTSVVQCRTPALARRFSREERQDVNKRVDEAADGGHGAPPARQQPAARLARRRRGHQAARRRKASLTIVLVPFGQKVAVLTLTSQTGFNPIRRRATSCAACSASNRSR